MRIYYYDQVYFSLNLSDLYKYLKLFRNKRAKSSDKKKLCINQFKISRGTFCFLKRFNVGGRGKEKNVVILRYYKEKKKKFNVIHHILVLRESNICFCRITLMYKRIEIIICKKRKEKKIVLPVNFSDPGKNVSKKIKSIYLNFNSS